MAGTPITVDERRDVIFAACELEWGREIGLPPPEGALAPPGIVFEPGRE